MNKTMKDIKLLKKLYLPEGGSHVNPDDPDTKERVKEIIKKELLGGAYEKES